MGKEWQEFVGSFHGITFKPSLAAAFRWRSSKLKNTFASKTSAAATCNKSKAGVGQGYHS
jgi:hypothetical protein